MRLRWLLAVLVPVVLASGCASRHALVRQDPTRIIYTAKADSLDMASFLALPEAERATRRDLAREWLDQARRQTALDAKVQCLVNVAGLTPDDPEAWLQLAGIWCRLGLYLDAESCLDRATAAMRRLQPGEWVFERGQHYRREIVRRTALTRAWLHYDRAEWAEGLDWAAGAARLEPGDDAAMLILGLLKGASGQWSHAQEISRDMRRRDAFNPDATWVNAISEVGLGRTAEAFGYMLHMRPNRLHISEAWRDMGRVAERVREWSYALRWYRESAAALQWRDRTTLVQVQAPVLDPAVAATPLPVWVAFDRYYVTGSLSAYAALALNRFRALLPGPERDYWAGAVVNATGVCVRLGIDEAWALRARGLVFAGTSMPDLGLADLRRAAELLGDEGKADPEIAAALGHLLLMKENHFAALPYLNKAVELAPDDAAAWSDLGLALIMTGDTDAADKALSRALAIDPRLIAAWYNRGLMHLHAGRLEQAETDLREAARLAPGNPEVGELLQQTRRLIQRDK